MYDQSVLAWSWRLKPPYIINKAGSTIQLEKTWNKLHRDQDMAAFRYVMNKIPWATMVDNMNHDCNN